MRKLTPDDPETRSADIPTANMEGLKALFPEAFTEGKVDFEVLKQLLGGAVEEREEKYGLNWHGKRQARQLALTPSTGTLRPCPEDSVDWDTTQNLVIEGDNLEVLKLLQKSYSGKVKLIYIDPPYNTGSDFIYPDDFRDNIRNYLELTGQVDEGGRRLTSNTEASGRFHTDWLNMMYPRLKLARSLLREDGVIFVSIDDNEIADLRMLMDEVFGQETLVEQIVWKNKYGSGALTTGLANVHEYILCYGRSMVRNVEAPLSDEEIAKYRLKDGRHPIRGGYVTQPLATTSKDDRPNLRYPIYHEGHEIWPEKQWIWAKERFDEAYANDEIVITEKGGKFSVRAKQYLRSQDGSIRRGKPLSLMNGPFNQDGTKEMRELFGERAFDFPKPSGLLRRLLSFVINDEPDRDGLYLDFFAGSCTTAQAVLELNREDGGRRRFIMVQLPEPTDRPKFPTIANLGEERIRRVIARMKEQAARNQGKLDLSERDTTEDLGFRVLRLDRSNIRAWDPDRDDLPTTLAAAADHLRADRTEADLLHELLLKLGLDLCVPMESRAIAGKQVHSVGSGVLFACLAETIGRKDVDPLAQGIVAWHKALDPAGEATCVFRDSAFADDVAKTNLTAILEQHGFDKDRVHSL